MNKIDLIIDALRQAYEDTPGWVEKVNEAIYAARELKALKPVAWMDKKDCGDMRFTSVEPAYENDLIPLYDLGVTK